MLFNRKALLCFNFCAYSFLLAAQAIYPFPSFASDGDSSLGRSNFTTGMPSSNFDAGVFHYQSPLSGGMSPSSAGMAPVGGLMSPESNFSPYSAGAQDKPTNEVSDTSTAWYKFLEPSLNLSRTLGESERHRILTTVPMPPDIHGRRKGDDHIVLLRAEATQDYQCFKTIWGSLFGRSGSLVLVSTTGLVVRMANLNGREKDVLFKLPNGQIITIGPGSEMVISKILSPHDVTTPDGIARRGLTRTMKCSEMQMAFAQFSYASALALPELKFYTKNQNAKDQAALAVTVAKLNEVRGTEGFKLALDGHEPAPVKSNEPRAAAAKKVVVKLVPVKKPVDPLAAKPAEASQTAHVKEDEHKQELLAQKDLESKKVVAKEKEEQAKKELAAHKAEESKKALAQEKKEQQHKKERALQKEQAAKKELALEKEEQKKKETARENDIERKQALAAEKKEQREKALARDNDQERKKVLAVEREEQKQREIAQEKSKEQKKLIAAKNEREQKTLLAAQQEIEHKKELAARREEERQKEIALQKEAESKKQIALEQEAAAKKAAHDKEIALKKEAIEKKIALKREAELKKKEAQENAEIARAKAEKEAAEKIALERAAAAIKIAQDKEAALQKKAAHDKEIAQQKVAHEKEIAQQKAAAHDREIALQKDASQKKQIASKTTGDTNANANDPASSKLLSPLAALKRKQAALVAAIKPPALGIHAASKSGSKDSISSKDSIASKAGVKDSASSKDSSVDTANKDGVVASKDAATNSKSIAMKADKASSNSSAKSAEKPKLAVLSGKLKEKIAKTIETAKTTASAKSTTHQSVPPSNNTAVASSNPRYLLPKMVPGPDTPPDIAKSLLDANKEERTAIALRKKADRCFEYISGGLLSYEQQKKMEVQARQALKQANEAEERSQALRRQVEIAGSGRSSTQ